MKIDMQEILSWPLTTNKIKLSVDMNGFFCKYSIVSYYSFDKEYKNLAYEQLADTPCLAVTGIRARWNEMNYPGIKFFILIERDKASEVKGSLGAYYKIRSMIDTLEDYDEKLQTRIIASLAINSLGKSKKGKMMYNDGSLLLCDDKNFCVNRSRKELVCLKIEINEYLNLTAKTTSFSNPKTWDAVNKNYNCVFQVSKDIDGQWWSGLAVKPIVVNKLNKRETNLEDLFIKKKRFSEKHNIVPYWPYNSEDYTHGRLFAISQVVQSVNETFNPILIIEFEDFKVDYYDAYKSEADTMAFMTNYLNGRSILIEDPFKTAESKDLVKLMKAEFRGLLEDTLVFPTRQKADCMLIKLCEPKEEELAQTHYSKSLYRMANSGVAIQHVIFHNNDKEDTIPKSEARRILLELLVKDCLVRRKMPEHMNTLMTGWEFIRYKINQGMVVGASLKSDSSANLTIVETGFSGGMPTVDFESFAMNRLHFEQCDKIRGVRDYMALVKDGNIFLIVDTDEIPILDVCLIDDAYGKVVNEKEPLSLFKRKQEAHKYLRGYIGFHLWKTEGLDGEKDGSYSYISGTNSENMQIMKGTKMDRMPRVRRIFVLHAENPNELESQVMEICGMLKFGLGRWNELMTYPFPFKFLQEYLDDASETAYSKHWSEITANKDL